MISIPESMQDLIERPIVCVLTTIRPGGMPQANPMWFMFDGRQLLFTHTDERQKYRNVAAHPEVAVCVMDPNNARRYLEFRGRVVSVEPDPEGAFFQEMARRYGGGSDRPPPDAAHRVVLRVDVSYAFGQEPPAR